MVAALTQFWWREALNRSLNTGSDSLAQFFNVELETLSGPAAFLMVCCLNSLLIFCRVREGRREWNSRVGQAARYIQNRSFDIVLGFLVLMTIEWCLMTIEWWLMTIEWCLMSIVWCLMTLEWWLMTIVWSLLNGVWSLLNGVWSLLIEVWWLLNGVWLNGV